MTDLLLQFGISNLLISLGLAIVAWAVHITGKRPLIAHLLWMLVLVKLVTPPIFTIPVVPVPDFSAATTEALLDLSALDATSAGLITAELESAGVDPNAVTFDSSAVTPAFLGQAKTGLIVFWVLGSVCILAWSLIRIHRFNRLLGIATEAAPPEVQHSALKIAKRLGLKAAPTIYTTSAHVSPMVWWIGGRVRIIISSALPREMDAEQLRWVLAHELAHVKRRDHLVRWLEWLACVFFWWNPVAWWARRNLRINEEMCCDALVLDSFQPRPQTYANALMKVVEFLASPAIRPPAVASEITSGGFLERRFQMIVSNNPIPRTQRWLRASILVCAAALLPFGMASADHCCPEHAKDKDGAVEKKTEDVFLNALAEAVAYGVMDGKAAFELYVASKAEEKQKLVEAGKCTAEQYDQPLGMGFRYKIAEAQIKQAVDKGEITEEQAKERLEGLKKRVAGDHDKKRDKGEEQRRGRIARALHEGGIEREKIADVLGAMKRIEHEMREEGEAFKLNDRLQQYLEDDLALTSDQIKLVVGLSQRLAHAEQDEKPKGEEQRRGRIAKALHEAGIEREKIEGVLGAMERIQHELRQEGEDFELDERLLKYLEDELELTGDQIKLVVGISQRLAYAERDERREAREWDDGMVRRIAIALVEAGIEREAIRQVMGAMERITAEIKAEGDESELHPRILEYLEEELSLTDEQIELVVGLSQRLAYADRGEARERGEGRTDWDAIRRRIEHAVENGDMTREEADTLYRGIRERMGRGRDR